VSVERVEVKGYPGVVARPRFTPDEGQRRLLGELEKIATRRVADDARTTELIAAANESGVPIEHIARHAGVTVKTVYRRLGYQMR
jgi:AcrR family transcriptional regulator